MTRLHDAEVKIKDCDRAVGTHGPSGKIFVFGAEDGSIESGVRVQSAGSEVLDQAKGRFDPENYDHNEVIARIWVNDSRNVERVEWMV